MQQNQVTFNIPWAIYENYWICAALSDETELSNLEQQLKYANLRVSKVGPISLAVLAPKNWADTWRTLKLVMAKSLITNPKVALLPCRSGGLSEEAIMLSLESTQTLDNLAENMWLAEALVANKLECFYQPVFDQAENVYGFESFARLRMDDGQMATGQKIISTAKEIGLQHMLDKHLHMLAIQTFAKAGLGGILFINSVTGFEQLPEAYLEKLVTSAREWNLNPRKIVLDIPVAGSDPEQVAQMASYCRQIGLGVALEDIPDSKSLEAVLVLSVPDFVKLDRKFGRFYQEPEVFTLMEEIIATAQKKNCKIVAQNVETEDSYKLLIKSGVNLFQGYRLGIPMSAQLAATKRTA